MRLSPNFRVISRLLVQQWNARHRRWCGHTREVCADVGDVGIRQNFRGVCRHAGWLSQESDQAVQRPWIRSDVRAGSALARGAVAFVAAHAEKRSLAFCGIAGRSLLPAPSRDTEKQNKYEQRFLHGYYLGCVTASMR